MRHLILIRMGIFLDCFYSLKSKIIYHVNNAMSMGKHEEIDRRDNVKQIFDFCKCFLQHSIVMMKSVSLQSVRQSHIDVSTLVTIKQSAIFIPYHASDSFGTEVFREMAIAWRNIVTLWFCRMLLNFTCSCKHEGKPL